MSVTPRLIQRPSVDRTVNLIQFISRDALSASMPFGRPQSQLPQKIARTLATGLAGVKDERPPPKESDEDYGRRVREYLFDHVEVADGSAVVTAVYAESM